MKDASFYEELDSVISKYRSFVYNITNCNEPLQNLSAYYNIVFYFASILNSVHATIVVLNRDYVNHKNILYHQGVEEHEYDYDEKYDYDDDNDYYYNLCIFK